MQLQTGDRIHGFRVLRPEYRKELNGNAVLMEHEKTGTPLFWLDNGQENKVFGIAFRTLPEDDTGVFHILEHSVLCGSDKFPVREPFVELLKSSMSTFLNAMTFPDMTLYPVGSRNDRDLLNLTEVYLDAVFAPACVREEKIFRQEGWHIEEDESGAPVYKGVVFNEMKGALSDVDSLLEQQISRQLFPDTSYGFNSGGEPEHIPDLTWDRFREAYRRYYHPSNALIYLDGSVPLEEMLRLCDSYLGRYTRSSGGPALCMQRPKASEQTIFYELAEDENEKNKGYYTVSRLTGTWQNRAENMARGIVCDVLTGSNEAPMKRAALERGLAQDLTMIMDDTGYQSFLSIRAERVTDGKEGEIEALIRETGENILRNGLDLDAAEASLNRGVYQLREEEEPQGIGRCIRCLSGWLYGGDPAEALESDAMVAEIRKMLRDGRLNALAADMLLNREGAVVVRALPSRTLGAERREKEAQRLRAVTAAWTPEEAEQNERMLEILTDWQQTPDTEEALATLPALKKEDADTAPAWTDTEQTQTEGIPTMLHRIPCNGVMHLRAYFPLTDCTLEELTAAAGLGGLLGRLPTEAHDAWSLQQEIKRWTGSLGFGVTVYSSADQSETCTPCLVAYTSALKENADRAMALLSEILTGTCLDEDERIADIIQQTEMGVRQRIISAGHSVGLRKAMSGYSAEGAVRNALEGEQMIRFIHALAREPEARIPAFRDTLKKILRRTVCRSRMTVSVTCEDDVCLTPLLRDLPQGTPVPAAAAYHVACAPATGYRIPAQIGFAVRAGRLDAMGVPFHGSMLLASGLISLGYLWNRVRVQGGAYGAGFSVDRAGNVYSYSYRDPTPAKTLGADSGIPDFLRAFAASGEPLDRYVISSLNELNPLLSPREKGVQADLRLLTGYTRDKAEQIRQQVLHTTPDQLAACADWIETFARTGTVCVMAHEDALKECRGLEISEL